MAVDFALICSSLALIFMLVVGIAIFFKLARVTFKWLITIILNSVMGVVLFFLLNAIGTALRIQSLQIPLWPQIVPVALFGLPALVTMLILKFFGVPVF